MAFANDACDGAVADLMAPERARDVGDWIDAKAKAEGRALNRVIINAMAEYPSLKVATPAAAIIGCG